METFGQVGCSVRRPARSGWAQARWVGFHPLFRGGRCNRGVVPLPIRFTARKDGDLRSDRVLGEDAGTIIFVSVRAQPHDQDGGDLRSGRVLGQETGTIIFVSRPGKMETFGQVGCSTEADGDLRSGRVLGRETTHPFHGGHRRHDQDEGTAGTTKMRANIFPTGGKLALIAGNKTEKKKGFTTFKWRIL